jgi:hypothetical protein
MRRLAPLLFALSLGLPVAACAQSLWLGAKAGVDRASWSGNLGASSKPYGTRTGVTAGATVSLRFSELLALQLEALYSEKGATRPDGFRADVAYVEIPLLVRLTLPLRALPIQPMAMAGVAPAWEISCGALARPNYIPEAPPPPAIPMDCIGWRTERRDVGTVLAGGVEIPMRGFEVTAEVRRTSGHSNIARGYTLSTYNGAWSFVIGAAFAVRT